MGVVFQGGNNVIEGGLRVFQHIVEDGLIMFLDPNNENSYAGSGTTVFNIAPSISSNGITGSLDSESMYVNPSDSSAYFRVRSDSVIERLELSDTIRRPSTGSSTLMFYFWSDYDSEGQYGNSQAFFGGKYTNYMALMYTSSNPGVYTPEAETNGSGTPQGNHDYFARTGLETGAFPTTGSWSSWTSIIHNETGSNWFNGVPGNGQLGRDNEYHLSSSTSTHSFSRLGSTSTGTHGEARGGDIRMGALLLYNRPLTEEEIKQNLDVLDRRFR